MERFSRESLDMEAAERSFRVSPPNSAPGQDPNDDGWGDIFGQANSGKNAEALSGIPSSFDVVPFTNSQVGAVPGGTPPAGVQNQYQPQTASEVLEVAAAKAGIVVFKGIVEVVKDFGNSFSNNTPKCWAKFGGSLVKRNAFLFGFGVILSVLGNFSTLSYGMEIVTASLFGMVIGLVLLGMYYEKGKQEALQSAGQSEGYDSNDQGQGDYGGSPDFRLDEVFEIDDDDEAYSEDDDEDDDFSSLSELYNSSNSSPIDYQDLEVLTPEEALNSLGEVPTRGTYTRSYLFETFSKVLPKINPKFSELKLVSENSDEFLELSKLLRLSARQSGLDESKLPEIRQLYKNLFLLRIVADRPTGLKEAVVAEELANAYRRDHNGIALKSRDGVYATVDSYSDKYVINLFLGDGVMVSLGDIYLHEKDFVLNPSIKFPLVWGVNELGSVWEMDGDNSETTIISGLPRGGKSWTGQAYLAQWCMYWSPKEVIFEVMDVKGTTSDYYKMCQMLPHFKSFESNPKIIIRKLVKIVTEEKDRRSKVLEKYDCISIKDFKEKHPNEEFPYLCIVIDEIMGLVGSLDDEGKAKFAEVMGVLISQTQNLGIRLLMFPHRIVNNIIPKNVYSLVATKAAIWVKDADELKSSMDVTAKTFPYNLKNKGDMAMRTPSLNSGKAFYNHGVVLTPTNEGNAELFRYIGEVWKRLEPDCSLLVLNDSKHIPIEYVEPPVTEVPQAPLKRVKETKQEYQEEVGGLDVEDDYWN